MAKALPLHHFIPQILLHCNWGGSGMSVGPGDNASYLSYPYSSTFVQNLMTSY